MMTDDDISDILTWPKHDLFKWADDLFDPENGPWHSEWLAKLFRNSPFNRDDSNV